MQIELKNFFLNFGNTEQYSSNACDCKNQLTAYIQDGMGQEMTNNEENFLKNNNQFFIIQNSYGLRNLAYFQMKLKEKRRQTVQTIERLQKDLYHNNQIKAFIDDKGYLNFSFHLYLIENRQVLKLLEEKKKFIFDVIYQFDMKVYNKFEQCNTEKQNKSSQQQQSEPQQSVQTLDVKLCKLVNVVKSNMEQQRIYYQVQGSDNLCEDIYKNLIEIDKHSYGNIQQGQLNKLEEQINRLLISLDISIQETLRNLFLTIYLKNGEKKHYQFNQLMFLSEFFDSKLQLNETFQVRFQLLIQILCAYLLKIYLNLHISFPQKDIILINSRKQIKLDMLAYLKYSSSGTEQLQQPDQMIEISNYFEILLPNRERPIILDNYNITNELQNMKQLIKQNKITVSDLVKQLVQMDKDFENILYLIT
ncbi:unnamed protein product (macronuclear) [Paramecium tetraurelia]|uniref:Uncharacterized protein n=1 Tax=Paramecium tetraurelia TaxID=5888 RepID=A0D2A4_PARTE|nr:uncharacterized protein GSPATT00012677001 [Paramecium tetraurelia]CAK77171.1 unnamed protein product [Paramecium tetraurelia]|eukprot:XP_001444568.1 hypothetical protein (macronuclear) [Paramecium tetraurelia strain d4-2]